ncbi:MAG: spermidine/putrescine ABC transporter substrate-binding protein [Nocardioides sp.]|uniref:polyamine ABC transporter substrate-binding protein n=1 Tax=Nocardioides sp. TaxID=35761 RepID=UPI0039E60631
MTDSSGGSPRGAAARLRVRRSISRRSFLRGLSASMVVPATGSLLSGCGNQLYTSGDLVIASPEHPVKWPLSTKNPPIEAGQIPEPGSTLRLYNYADYIGPAVLKAFKAKYDVDVSVSTFNSTDEALTKIASGAVEFDIYFPSYDQIGKMVAGDLLRPLTHDYITNVGNLWPMFRNPWYDQGWQYSVPYTVYTTGIGWRADRVDLDIATLDNPYDVFWDSQFRGRTAVIDDFHTTMAMVLLRNGIRDVNTGKVADLDLIRTQLKQMTDATDPRVTITMYNDLPAGQFDVSMMWSGDLVNAQYYLPKGVSPEVLRYWFNSDGYGTVDNDLMVLLASGKNPVAAHHFLNFMLDADIASKNFSYTGYQPPQRSINPDTLVEDGFLPEQLSTAAVQPAYFRDSPRLLELNPVVDAQWHNIWQEYKANG